MRRRSSTIQEFVQYGTLVVSEFIPRGLFFVHENESLAGHWTAVIMSLKAARDFCALFDFLSLSSAIKSSPLRVTIGRVNAAAELPTLT